MVIMTETVRDIEKNLPTDWILTSFENILSEPMRNGIYKKKDFHGRGVKVVNMGELFLYDFIENQDMKKVELTSNEIDKYCLKEGDLLFARRSLILEGSGKCSIVRKTEELTTFESSIIRARPNKDKVSSGYLFYLFKSTIGRDIVQSIATRTAVSGIRGSELAKLVVPIPPKSIQFKITSILSAYDYLIENNLRRIKILEEMAQNLYREWFVNFRFPGHENTRFVDSPLGKIPEGWEVVKLGDLIKIRKGKNITKNTVVEGLTPVIAGGKSPAYYHNESNTKHPVVTISASGANAGFVWLHYENVWASDCSVIDIDTTQHVYYYYLQLKDRKVEVDNLQRGAAQPHVYPKDLMGLETIEMPSVLLDRFSLEVSPLFQMIGNLYRKNQNLRQTGELLLPKLISGEVDVSGLDIKVPEEVVS